MSILDYVILAIVAMAVVGAILYLRKHGNPCQGCDGCSHVSDCKKKR